jgi:hypothetical protein
VEILVAFVGTGCLVWVLRRTHYKTPPLIPELARYGMDVWDRLMGWNDRVNRRYWGDEPGA